MAEFDKGENKVHRFGVAVSVFALAAMSCSVAHGKDNWHTFSPPQKDFSVMVPGAVITRKAEGMTYFTSAKKNGSKYVVMYQTENLSLPDKEGFNDKSLDDLVIGFKKGAKGTSFADNVSSMNGNGWEGRQLSSSSNGHPQTWLLAVSKNHDTLYTLMATEASDRADAQRFLRSFKIDPSIASKVHPQPEHDYAAEGYKSGQLIGKLLAPVLIIGFIGWLIFRKRKNA